MKVSCPSCQTTYNIDDKRIPPGGAKLKCAKCQTTFPIRAEAPSAAVPLPGSFGAGPAVPLPSTGARSPGGSPFPPVTAVPLPGSARAASWDEESTRVAAVPLPSGPGAFDSEATRVAPMPIPPPSHPGVEGAMDFADPSDVEDAGAVPLPGASFDFADPLGAPSAGAVDFGGMDFSGPPAPPGRPAGGMDFSDLPSPVASRPAAIDFGELPSPANAAAIDFGDLPSPAPAARSDFSQLPSGPPPPEAAMDFADLPAPAEDNFPSPAPPTDFGLDFAEPPPASSPSASAAPAPRQAPPPPDLGFGEVDFGDPAPARAAASRPPADPLEFDPMSASKPADDLEADLSAPIPAPKASGPADGLEMLSFIDDAAKDAGAGGKTKVKRFHVRRRSGKVFGPFEEGVVVKMLEDGQLLGNEDISTDGDSWSPMATEATLGQTIQKLMESPAAAASAVASTPDAKLTAQQAQTMDRLKNLYEGRMAAVAVVDRRQEHAKFKKRLPLLIGAGVSALILVAGGSMGFTRYGLFGIKAWLPSKLSASSPHRKDFEAAKQALMVDTFKSYREARDLAGGILQQKEYPEVRAVWMQAVFYLDRRYAAATEAERSHAQEALVDIELLGRKNVEVAKALAGARLIARDSAGAVAVLMEAKSFSGNDQDVELDALMAEARELAGDRKGAQEALQAGLGKNAQSAKLHYALGNLHQVANEAELAAASYEKALAAQPGHVASAVELGAVELLVRRNIEKGAAAVRKALESETAKEMGPAERARARALLGVALAAQFKPEEASKELDAALELDPSSVFAKAMLGRVLLGRREFARALPFYREAQQREPTNLEYTDGYLQTLIATGKMNDALNVVQGANARFPGNARIAYLFGTVSEALDNTTEAEGHYKRAAKADPTLFVANLSLGRLYLRFKRLDDAAQQLAAAVAQAPEDAGVRAGLGELAIARDDFTTARAEFERALRSNPNLAEVRLGLSEVAAQRGELELALSEVDQALVLDARLRGARLRRGLSLWKLGRLDEAVAELNTAKEQDPKSARIAIAQAAVLLDKQDLAAAEKAALSALTVEPSNHEAHYYLARIKSRRAEHTQAIDSMRSALDGAPQRSHYHFTMGNILREAKKLPEAIESYRKASELDASSADALEALGVGLLERGDIDAAVVALDKALKADPKRISILGLQGDAYFQAARWDKAIERYEQALQKDRSLVHLHYRVGRCFAEKGNGARAIHSYQQATRVDGKNPMPFYYLGFAYKERNKRRDAVEAFKDYLRLKPDAEDKKEIQDEIFDLEN